jgi:hypothetical protein
MRALFETDADRQREDRIAQSIAARWRCALHKLPIRYKLDYVMVRDDEAIGFCEVKARQYEWAALATMGGVLLSIGKWCSARELCQTTERPFLFAVAALDGIWTLTVSDFRGPQRIKWHGRDDREDWQDREPCVMLDCARFVPLAPDRILQQKCQPDTFRP